MRSSNLTTTRRVIQTLTASICTPLYSRAPHSMRLFSASAPSSAASAPRRFAPPPDSPAGFLAELRSFANHHMPPNSKAATLTEEELTHHLPLSFSGSATALLTGKRRVVTPSSTFNFSCTACGACCRSYPNDVMLDPSDIYRMSRSEGLIDDDSMSEEGKKGFGSTTWMYRQYPKAFRQQLGLFEEGDSLIEEDETIHIAAPASSSASSPQPLASRHKLAPVLFLNTKKIKRVSKSSGAQSSEERCWFAYKSEKIKPEAEEIQQEATPQQIHTSNISPIRVSAPRSTSASLASSAGLKCRLGPANQPTSCALYPLGELYSPREFTSNAVAASSTSSASSQQKRTQYYSLDVTNCEGVSTSSSSNSSSTTTTVDAYARRNDLYSRRAAWNWFEREIAQKIAVKGWLSLDSRTAVTADVAHPSFYDDFISTIALIWYDYDSLQCTPIDPSTGVQRFPDWPSIERFITSATETVIELTTVFLHDKSIIPHSTRRREWRNQIAKHGLFLRDHELK